MTVSPRARRNGFVLGFGLLAIGSIVFGAARPAQQQAPAVGSASSQSPPAPSAARGAEIVVHGGYPELRVNGECLSSSTPRRFSITACREISGKSRSTVTARLGINTIDIYIPWNWHELQESQFDFDGHTNPRRDLRALLKLLAAKNLKLIARPGPLHSE